MKSNNNSFHPLREYLGTLPIIDCHDHTHPTRQGYPDAIAALFNNYAVDELISATSDANVAIIQDTARSLEERWPYLEKAWKRTGFTGYSQPVKRVLKHFYNEDSLSLDSLERIQTKLINIQDNLVIERVLEEANIVLRLEDICWITDGELKLLLNGTLKMPPRSVPVISLPRYHEINSAPAIYAIGTVVGKTITCLDEYLAVCREIFEGYKRFGAVAFKDQSAYRRSLHYTNPTRGEAEKVFNWIMEDPRRIAAYPDGIAPLDDYLFHAFMRMARDMDLPVQIHTGQMAMVRNDIVKTNAVQLTRVLELHRDVRFDLFHANWPYSGELLFLAKNYPNVAINFCWTNIVDPLYCQRLFQQILSCVPHGKVHGFGADFAGNVEFAWAHAEMAKDNIAVALSEMVEMEFCALDEAKRIAYGWLYDNPRTFFRLDKYLNSVQ